MTKKLLATKPKAGSKFAKKKGTQKPVEESTGKYSLETPLDEIREAYVA